MTRRLLALFSPSLLAAQVQLTPTAGGGGRIPRPKNGECPVCGTMAEKYHVSKGDEHFFMGLTNYRHVDCEYCNTTFRQWAEGKEPKR